MPSYAAFLRGLMEDPRAVSAPTPSGTVLSDRLAAQIDPSLPGKILELGPGTGVVTRALIKRGVDCSRLILVESNAYFCELLERRYPAATVIRGDAVSFGQYVDENTQIAGVMSGLPLLNFDLRLRKALILGALERQGPLGRFVQLSYGWRPAVDPGPRLSVTKAVVWRNLPPAHIWTYRFRTPAKS